MLQRRYAAASLLLCVFLLTRAQLDHVALQPNRLCQRNAVRSHSSHTTVVFHFVAAILLRTR